MAGVDTSFKGLRRVRVQDTEADLRRVFKDIREDVENSVKKGSRRLIAAGWNGVLADVILEANMATASEIGRRVASALTAKKADDDEDEYDPEIMRPWLKVNADASARAINGNLESKLRARLAEDNEDDEDAEDPVAHVFNIAETSGAAGLAVSMVALAANFGAKDAANARGAGSKMWSVNSGKPRASHKRMDGETAGMDEAFSNGMMFPGDPVGGAEEVAECQCSITIIR